MFGRKAGLCALLLSYPAHADLYYTGSFPAKVYRGPIAKPDFARNAKWLPAQRVIRASFRSGPNFAGHFRIVPIGCGADCVNFVMGDVITGKLYDFPIGGEGYYGLDLVYSEQSRTISAYWTDSVENRTCFYRNYVLTDTRFIPWSKVTPTGHPCAVIGDGRGND